MWAAAIVNIGTEATITLALMAKVSLRAKKKKAKLRLVPKIAQSKKNLKSSFLIFKLFVTNGQRIRLAKNILRNARENKGIDIRVSFIMGAVAPHTKEEIMRKKTALLRLTGCGFNQSIYAK